MSFPFLQQYTGLSNSLQTAQATTEATGPGGWVEVARTTLGSAGDDLDVSSIPDKRYYMLLLDFQYSGNIQPGIRLGNSTLDSGSNYAERWSTNGGSEVTQSNTYHVQWVDVSGKAKPIFGVNYISNLSGKEKLGISHIMNPNSAGAGNAPDRQESVFKWTNTSNPLDILGYNNKGSGDFDTNSEVVVLGYDPADTHTTNFWQELDSTSFSGSASEFTSGTFTAKKYLWVQYYVEGTASLRPFSVRFNGDTAGNYAIRRSALGAADSTFGSVTSIDGAGGQNVTNFFVNMFIINNSANEKLVIAHSNSVVTQGAGTAPRRDEIVGKWSNTSNQITSITARSADSGNITTGEMRVWGSD